MNYQRLYLESLCKLYLNERKESEKNEFFVLLFVNVILVIWYKKKERRRKKIVIKIVYVQVFDDILGYILKVFIVL